jgi:Subtilase family/PA domain
MRRKSTTVLLILALILSFAVTAFAQDPAESSDRGNRELPPSVAELKLDSPLELEAVGLDALNLPPFGEGAGKVIIRLSADSVAEGKGKGQAPGQVKKLAEAQQASFLDRVLSVDPNARVLAQVQVVMNAVFVEVDPSALAVLANDPAVVRIAPVANYELDLSETVPYIGATAVHNMGYDGTGIRVAVLDSGIDYTHIAFGGSGNPADFAANNPDIIEPGTFPTAKVIGGYDFVGSTWPTGPLAPDPDPLDKGSGAGHGTHVGHIIGGVGGVAPGASLYAVKVCSSVSTSCSGVALIQGMEFAADPDGDPDTADAVNLINMSLGSDYGQPFDDDLSFAVENATKLGILTVASAGNGSDKPYVLGTPSATASALSVAQTAVPSAVQARMRVVAPASIAGLYNAVFQPWSAPLTTVIEGPLQYGDGANGNLDGCAAFAAGSLANKIVLVNRGNCNFTLKIKNIADGGGLIGIIGLIAPGDPFEGGDGGDRPITIPGYMISQADSNKLKGKLVEGVVVRFDPADGIPLVGTVVGSSSRGPQHESTTLIKPEIGAPGASVSAIYGTGTGEGPFGGTSGAAPMVTGSAALLLQAAPNLSPLEAKARLMNNAETEIYNGALAPLAAITRIGGGEVRADRAVTAPAAAWDEAYPAGALSFGFVDVKDDTITLHKTVHVRNYSNKTIVYSITPTFRFADDEANGAVSLQAPPKVTVKAGKDATFPVKLTINGAMLRANYMNSGSMGASPAGLTLNEYDGYLVLDDGSHPIHLAWHVLPRKAANVVGRSILTFDAGVDVVDLTNNGVGTAQDDAYSLLAVSPDQPEGGLGAQSPTPDIRAVGINTFPVPAGYCSANPSFLWAFAVNTWERQEHLLPVKHYFYLDTNQDGAYDYAVLNADAGGLNALSDGRQLAYAWNLTAGTASAFFYAEHSMNTGNTVLYICAEQVGLTAADMLSRNVNLDVYTQDWYYGGPGDWVTGLTVTPYGEQYYGVPEDIAGKSYGTLTVYDFGLFPGNSPELGVMLVTNGDRGSGNRGGATQDTEALLFTVK